METVDFYPATMEEIDEQDNPANGSIECFIIVGVVTGDPDHMAAEVYHIKPDTIEPTDSVAIFWKLANAQEYCDFLL